MTTSIGARAPNARVRHKGTAHPPARQGLPLCSPRHRPTGDPHVDEDHAGRRGPGPGRHARARPGQQAAPDHLGRLRARRRGGAVQEGDRHRRRDHALEQRGDDLQAARHRRRRLRPGPALAGPHHRPAAGVRHLQADGPVEDQVRALHPSDARGDEEEHHARGQGLRPAAHLGHRWPRGEHQERADRRLPRPVQGRLQGQDLACG